MWAAACGDVEHKRDHSEGLIVAGDGGGVKHFSEEFFDGGPGGIKDEGVFGEIQLVVEEEGLC